MGTWHEEFDSEKNKDRLDGSTLIANRTPRTIVMVEQIGDTSFSKGQRTELMCQPFDSMSLTFLSTLIRTGNAKSPR